MRNLSITPPYLPSSLMPLGAVHNVIKDGEELRGSAAREARVPEHRGQALRPGFDVAILVRVAGPLEKLAAVDQC